MEGSDIVLRGAPATIDRVELHGSRLVLRCRPAGGTRLEVSLPGTTLHRIGISGAARVALEDFHQPALALRIRGSGSVQAHGAVDRLSVNVAGSGEARLGGLATRDLTVKVSGSGDVEASPTAAADVAISGSGRVRLLTRPARLDTRISGSGRLVQPD